MQSDGLQSLGSPTTYHYTAPGPAMLETFPNSHPGKSYQVMLESSEFTSLCPKTGQPDFARIRIQYVPAARCVESKSLKLYLFAFRQHGAFMEAITNQIAEDLVAVLQPVSLQVVTEFASRGGISITTEVSYPGAGE